MEDFFTLLDYNITLGEVILCKRSEHIGYFFIVNKYTALLDKTLCLTLGRTKLTLYKNILNSDFAISKILCAAAASSMKCVM